MAKGDDARSRNRIDYEGDRARQINENVRTGTVLPQNQQFWNNYTTSVDRATQDYGNLQAGFKNFQDTGGFSDMDLANIRARALSPTRAVYSNALREVDRSKTLQGGYSPGHNVLRSRMARDMSQGLSDAAGNTEGMIAQLVNQGKQFGLQGGANLYGMTPGAANMFGNQLLNSTGQLIDTAQLDTQLGLGLADAQINAAKLPGKWESTMGRINDIFDLGNKVAGMVYPWMQPGAGASVGRFPTNPGDS